MNPIEALCQEHTALSRTDIAMICEMSETLQHTADLAQANLFIDCPLKEGQHAIVVAEAAPQTVPTLYKEPVVGKFAYESFEPAVAYTHNTGKPATRKRAITQEGKVVKQSVVPIKNQQNDIIGSLILEQDMSEQIYHENKMKALSQTTEKLSDTLLGLTDTDSIISNTIQESLFLLDQDRHVVYANARGLQLAAEMAGVDLLAGRTITDIFPFLNNITFSKKEVSLKEVAIDKNVFEVKRIHLQKNQGILLILRDLTELRNKERELMVKSAVIKEMHHRIKNNLQTVASLLRLQKRNVPKESQGYFQESLNRILSIAAVHEELLAAEKFEAIDIHHLFKRIGRMLIRNKSDSSSRISMAFGGNSLTLKSDKAVSLALIFNELVQNCVKHAFNGYGEGKVVVHFHPFDDQMEMVIEDNGIGFNPCDKPTLGLTIVQAIANHDLEGDFSIAKAEIGTRASVRFPVQEVIPT
ncbi:two-component sensor histidine kinase [Scopulibacillus darangshiensis]|uniref:histidine kinase n=1 Tax=Scopulibacillus darangshiensis TaxID=442528 RepID=A0A4V2SNI6_9BACL|nr:sensor histidine kinase [Scopulibacillus darangshiensis]TCP31236.1 two-component sensor histidine kinase [Scopulibacillus darangshiensis]